MQRNIILLSIFWSFASSAQIRWGGVVGFQSTGIANNMDLVTTSRQGNLLAGIMADYRVGKSGVHILGQLLYAPMGYAKSNLEAVDQNGSAMGVIDNHRIGYISVPLYFLYKQENRKAKFGAGLGPVLSFKTGDKLKIKGGDTFGNGIVLPGNVKKINPVTMGMALYAGAEWSNFILALHGQQGFSNIYESRFPGVKWRINSFGFSAGYFFGK